VKVSVSVSKIPKLSQISDVNNQIYNAHSRCRFPQLQTPSALFCKRIFFLTEEGSLVLRQRLATTIGVKVVLLPVILFWVKQCMEKKNEDRWIMMDSKLRVKDASSSKAELVIQSTSCCRYKLPHITWITCQ
jgi:hypothetical protein